MDPVSGNPYDYGVNSYTEYGGAKDFFARFNISLVNMTSAKLNTSNIDFATGKPLVEYQSPSATNVTAAITRYLNLAAKYEDILLPSYANFPSEVPEELLTKFSEIVIKYDLQDCLPLVFQVTGFALGSIGDELLLFVLQEFSAPMARVILGLKDGWVPSTHRNQDLYDNIAALLGKDVLYSTTVVASNRTDTGVQLLVSNDKGEQTIIIAKKMLVSFALSPDNTAAISLSTTEQDVFSTWGLVHEYCGIVTSPALPINGSLVNIPSSAIPSNYLATPEPPFVVRYQYLGDKNFRILVTGTENYTIPLAKSLAVSTFNTLARAGDIVNGAQLTFAAFDEHTTTHQHIPAEVVKSGFYKKLYALQGGRSTFYTGRSWGGQFTTILWEFNNQWLLPKLLASF